MQIDASRKEDRAESKVSMLHMKLTNSAIMLKMGSYSNSLACMETLQACELVDLIEAVQSKNRAAFDQLYDATVKRVFSLALRITQHQEMAEEVVGDVYLQVWQQASSYSSDRGKVISWLCILCRSRALDALRRDKQGIRSDTISQDAVPEHIDLSEPVDLLQAVEQGSAIHNALGMLNEQQRQLVALAYFRGFSHSEIAGFTDMPIGTVKTTLRRTTIKLKQLMSSDAGI